MNCSVLPTKCQQEALERSVMADIYHPQCSADGKYRPMQCFADHFSEKCWCVDESGNPLDDAKFSRGSRNCGTVISRFIDRLTVRLIDWFYINWSTDRSIDWLLDWLIVYWLTDIVICPSNDWLIDWFIGYCSFGRLIDWLIGWFSAVSWLFHFISQCFHLVLFFVIGVIAIESTRIVLRFAIEPETTADLIKDTITQLLNQVSEENAVESLEMSPAKHEIVAALVLHGKRTADIAYFFEKTVQCPSRRRRLWHFSNHSSILLRIFRRTDTQVNTFHQKDFSSLFFPFLPFSSFIFAFL